MDQPEGNLSIRTPAQILAMHFPDTDRFLPNGIFTMGQAFGLVGPAGVGKSRLALQLAVCIMTGIPFLGWAVQKQDMVWLFIQTENSNPRLRDDLVALRAWVGEKAWKDVERNLRIHTLEGDHDSFLALDDATNSNLVYQAILEHKPGVILFDPLNAFSLGSLNTDAGMLASCRTLQKLATLRDPSTSIMIVHHSLAGKAGLKKAVGQEAGSYAKGSKAFNRAALRPLPPDLLYLLLPEQRELKVRSGHVWPTVAGISFQFSAPGLFADLGTGYRVMACFDPTEPTMGAWIFNAETGTANRDGHGHGAFLGHAEHCAEAPQFASPGYADENIERRRKHYRAFRVKYVSTGVFGRNAASASELRGGRGNVARIERGGSATATPGVPASGKRRRSANGEGDALVEKARAMQATKASKPAGPSIEELHTRNLQRRDAARKELGLL